MKYKCVRCETILDIPKTGSGVSVCTNCNHKYEYANNYLRYEFDDLLFRDFKGDYLLYKVLHNNGYLGYKFLPEGSLSLPGREDAGRFSEYIEDHISYGTVLDIGCGILELPSYLDFRDRTRFSLFGIDPIDDRSFVGIRIVGCSEYMPFQDGEFDAVILATSLDHVCSIDKTIRECSRILSSNGKVLIWMGDRSESYLQRGKNWLRRKLVNLKSGYRADKFVIYPNGTVFYVPHGAVDPFHAFRETPKDIVTLLERRSFRNDDMSYNNKNEIFLCFSKL
jgi:SAM-dependent methyltransferase